MGFSLANGSGKTFIAVNLLKRAADAGQLKRALFVCDRDELRSQAVRAFQNVFGADAAEVFRRTDELENPHIFQIAEVKKAGGLVALQAAGGSPAELLRETKERMLAALKESNINIDVALPWISV